MDNNYFLLFSFSTFWYYLLSRRLSFKVINSFYYNNNKIIYRIINVNIDIISSYSEKTQKILAYIAFGIFAISFILLIIFFKRISLAIKVLKVIIRPPMVFLKLYNNSMEPNLSMM